MQPKGAKHELTNSGIASRRNHLRTDVLSTVIALGDTSRAACRGTRAATLGQCACRGHFGRPEPVAVEALEHCDPIRGLGAMRPNPRRTGKPAAFKTQIFVGTQTSLGDKSAVGSFILYFVFTAPRLIQTLKI